MLDEVPHGWSASSVGQLFTLGKKGCNPSNSPRDPFLHYSIPALDETGGPIIEMGQAIEPGAGLAAAQRVFAQK